MATTLGFTGMDRNTQNDLGQAFAQAVERMGLDLRLVDSGEADIVVVDMDSLYGPMSWMQLHNAGRKVIGYTSAARTQTDYRLGRPHDAASISTLLEGLELGRAAPVTPPAQADTHAPEDHAAVPHGMTPAPVPMDVLPEEAPVAADEERDPAPEPVAEPVRDPVLADWLQPGRLATRGVYQRGDGPALYLDGTRGQYHGPATLKSLDAYFDGSPLSEADFNERDEAAWATEAAAAGPAQPIARLAWYAALLEGKGSLQPQLDPEGRFRMTKWLQTEREFPKHFRIATAMMKGPATVAEIAAAANVGEGEVADFVNAGLATSIVEQVLPEPLPAAEPAKGGLFGRMRGR